MTINHLGKVGIGTNSPSYNLHIDDTEDAAIYLEADNDNLGGEDDNPFIKFTQDNSANKAIIGMVGTAGKDPENNNCNSTIADAFYIGTTATGDGSTLQLGTVGYVRMTFNGAGMVGINDATPSYHLDVNGDMRVTGTAYNANPHWNTSDIRFKKNINNLEGVLDKVLKIRGTSYEMKVEEFKGTYNFNERKNFGFIAQELKEVFPELVKKIPDNEEYYAVNYIGMIPVLTEAIKEQQVIIEKQNALLEELYSKIDEQDIEIEEMQKQMQLLGVDMHINSKAILDQNLPNLFNESTEIHYSLSHDCQSAGIMIFDMNGTNLKTYKIDTSEKGKLTINAKELKPGMYIYSLITDGKEAGTKRMIITE